MGRVDEQQVAGLEGVEDVERDVLHGSRVDHRPLLVAGPHEVVQELGVGLDESDLGAALAVVKPPVGGVEQHRRRVPGTDLDHPLRAEVTQHGVEDDPVGPPVAGVVEVVAMGLVGLCRERKVGHEPGQRPEQRDLFAFAQVDPCDLDVRVEDGVCPTLDLVEVRVGRVEVADGEPGPELP